MDNGNDLFSRVLSERQAREEALSAKQTIDAEREAQRQADADAADEHARVARDLSNERASQFIDVMLQNVESVPLVEFYPAGYSYPNYWVGEDPVGIGWVIKPLRRGYSSAKGPSAPTVPGVVLSPTGSAYRIVQSANNELYLSETPPTEIGIDPTGPLLDPFASDEGLGLLSQFVASHNVAIAEDLRPRSGQLEERAARVLKWQEFEEELRRQGLQRRAQLHLRDSQGIRRFVDIRDSLLKRGSSFEQAILEAAREYDKIILRPLSDFGSDSLTPAFPPFCSTRVLAGGDWSGEAPPSTGAEHRELAAIQAFATARDKYRGGNAHFDRALALHTGVGAYVESVELTVSLGEEDPESYFAD